MASGGSIRTAASLIAGAKHIVCFTGAGISAESGIPTFRGTSGIWEKYPPSLFGNIPGLALAFLLFPGKVRNFAFEAIETIVNTKPNPGHEAIAEMEKVGIISSVITQNIDGLHEAAGSKKVLSVHGSIYVFRCRRCGERTDVDKEWLREAARRLRLARSSRFGLIQTLKGLSTKCEKCGGLKRPDVVFFGESLPADVFSVAYEEALKCNAMLVVGTSGLVYPAANLPLVAYKHQAAIIEVNPENSPLSALAAVRLRGTASEILPALLKEISSVLW